MPWSVKAQELLRSQYAAVGSAAAPALAAAVGALTSAAERGGDIAAGVRSLLDRTQARAEAIGHYVDAYRRYCWDVTSLSDLKLAPFHVLATEGRVHVDKDHAWHMGLIADLCAADEGLLRATPWRIVDLADPTSESAALPLPSAGPAVRPDGSAARAMICRRGPCASRSMRPGDRGRQRGPNSPPAALQRRD